jgi:hypothetical protein
MVNYPVMPDAFGLSRDFWDIDSGELYCYDLCDCFSNLITRHQSRAIWDSGSLAWPFFFVSHLNWVRMSWTCGSPNDCSIAMLVRKETCLAKLYRYSKLYSKDSTRIYSFHCKSCLELEICWLDSSKNCTHAAFPEFEAWDPEEGGQHQKR